MENDIKTPDNPDLYPPEPTKPLDSECCGTGCTPCVFDIYEKQYKQWKLKCDAVRKGQLCESNSSSTSSVDNFICPDQYSSLEILEIFKETENMKIFRISWPGGGESTEFPVKLGQHLLIKYKDVARQYSILRTDADARAFDILIKIYSSPVNDLETETRKMLTPLLDMLLPGCEITARGPFGLIFDYSPNSISHLFLIAAGTGIAPMCRVIETVLNNEEDETRIKLSFSCPSLQEVPLLNNFKKWSSFWNFDITYCLPDNKESCMPYYGMKIVKNRLDINYLREQIQTSRCQLDTSMFIICGTKSFEKDVINHLSKVGVDSSKIKTF